MLARDFLHVPEVRTNLPQMLDGVIRRFQLSLRSQRELLIFR